MIDKAPLDSAAGGWRRASPQKSLSEVHGDGTTVSAMSPFVKIPTDQASFADNVVKGGFIFPLAVGLPAGWSMGVMTEVDLFREVGTGPGARRAGTVVLGLTYGLTDNLQLDAGINIGVTGPADDLDPFVGLAWRF